MTHGSTPSPDSIGAGAPDETEIEITPGMMAAGLRAFALWDFYDPDEWKVSAVFRAMKEAEIMEERIPDVAPDFLDPKSADES